MRPGSTDVEEIDDEDERLVGPEQQVEGALQREPRPVGHVGQRCVGGQAQRSDDLGAGAGIYFIARSPEGLSLLEPSLVIPIHYATPATKLSLDALNKFLKEMGLSKVESQPSLKVTRSGLPDETKVVVLEYQAS